MNRKQRESVFRFFCRDFPHHDFAGLQYTGLNLIRRRAAYRRWRREHRVVNYGDYVGFEWCGMFIGVEKDGYAHS
jgi:hypothetical protein